MLLSVESASFGAGRLDEGIVCASTAANSAVRPTLSATLTSMPRIDQRAGDVELAVHQRQHERGVALGIDVVDVGAGLGEHGHAVHAPGPRRRAAAR